MSQSTSQSQLTCAEAIDMLQKWEGVENTTALLKGLLKEERGKLFHFIIVHEYSSIINYNKINDVQYVHVCIQDILLI